MLKKQTRTFNCSFETRADDSNKYIEGYFARFDDQYELAPDLIETISKGAFTDALAKDDIRALINHDTTLVLGRNTANTLTLREDDVGLFGSILINPNDQDALNIYARVQRGDVSQCSFGFDILDEEEIRTPKGMHWIIKNVRMYEVSVCTFPAYKATEVNARSEIFADVQKREAEAFNSAKRMLLEKINGGAE